MTQSLLNWIKISWRSYMPEILLLLITLQQVLNKKLQAQLKQKESICQQTQQKYEEIFDLKCKQDIESQRKQEEYEKILGNQIKTADLNLQQQLISQANKEKIFQNKILSLEQKVVEYEALIREMNYKIDQQEGNFQNLQIEIQELKSLVADFQELLNRLKEEQKSLYTIIIQLNQERETEIRKIINKLYDESWRKRHTEQQYKFFVRDIESQFELFKNYSIRQSQAKESLRNICTSFRQARGDGNCFYTAFGYQFLLILLIEYDDDNFFSFLTKMKKIKLRMQVHLQEAVNIDNQQIEQMLLDEFIYRLQQFRNITDLEERKQVFTFQFAAFETLNENTDGCLYGLSTIFFRNLANVAVETSELKEQIYDRHNLLIWETECNNNELVIKELSDYLKIKTVLLFFDNGGFIIREYGGQSQQTIILLIRPGHYNIGIKENENNQNQNQNQIEQQISLCHDCEPKLLGFSKRQIRTIDQFNAQHQEILQGLNLQ